MNKYKKNTLNKKAFEINVKIIPYAVFISFTLLFLVLNIIFNIIFRDDKLNEFTRPSLNSVYDSTYMDYLNRYYSDNFLLSNSAKTLTNTIKTNYGIKLINDVFILNDRLIYNTKSQNTTTAINNAQTISELIKKNNDKSKFYFGLIPTASEIYKNELPAKYNTLNQSKFISDIYNKLDTKTIDILSSLSSQRNNTLFYHTDSHLTSQGGYYVYSSVISAMEKSPIPLSSFDIQHLYHNYLGDLYNKVLLKPYVHDTIDLFYYNGFNVVDSVVKYNNDEQIKTDSIFFTNNLDTKNKLKVFLGNSSAITQINTHNLNSGNLLIFKDSSSDNLMQFLPLHFSNITLVDLDLISYENLKKLKFDEYDYTLFLYTVDTFNNNNFINSKLSHLL